MPDNIEIVNNADDEKLTQRFEAVCHIAKCHHLRMKAVENFMKTVYAFCKYADDEFKKHLVVAADNLIEIEEMLKKANKLLEEA